MDDAVGLAKKKGRSEPSRPSFPVQQNKRHTPKKGEVCKICIIQAVQQAISFGGGGGRFAGSPALGNQVISGGKYYLAPGNSI